jgi:hypothetical protein
MAKIEWVEYELIIALEFFYSCPSPMHTDSHAKCKEVAELLDRTPSALERILRNILYVDSDGQRGLRHASQTIFRLVGEYKEHQDRLKAYAAGIRAENGWPQLVCEG